MPIRRNGNRKRQRRRRQPILWMSFILIMIEKSKGKKCIYGPRTEEGYFISGVVDVVV